MYILCLDVSLKCTGWSVIYVNDFGSDCVDYNYISNIDKIPRTEKIYHIRNGLKKVIDDYEPTTVVIEAPLKVNAKVSESLNRLYGAIDLLLYDSGIETDNVLYIHLSKIKSFFSSKSKEAIEKKVKQYYYIDNIPNYDVSDSISVGVYYYENNILGTKNFDSIDIESKENARDTMYEEEELSNFRKLTIVDVDKVLGLDN